MHTRKSFYTPCRTDKMPLDPLFAVDLTNLGGENPPMSIEAVVHAEDAGYWEHDSVGTLLSKPCQSMVCSAMTRTPKAFFVTFCRLGQKVSKKPFEGVFVPSKWLRSPCKHKFSPLLSGGETPPLHIFKQQFIEITLSSDAQTAEKCSLNNLKIPLEIFQHIWYNVME